MASDHPNVLLLVSDEHNYRYFGHRDETNGGEPVETPAFDRLASAGTTFTDAYCSYPLCTPSRMSLLTGREPRNCGAWANKSVLPRGIPTIPSTFGDAGYETCLVGKMHFGGNRQFCGFDNRPYGDLTGLGGHQSDPLPDVELDAFEDTAKMPTEGVQRRHSDAMRGRTANAGVTEIPESLLQERNVVEETVAFVREHQAARPARPWFTCASFSRPHFPLTAPRRYLERYWPDGVTEPRIGREGDTADHPLTVGMAEEFQTDAIDETELLRARAAYFASVDFLDDAIGDLLALLDRDGLLEDTIVVYVSDHGELAGEHGLWWKQSWHEDAVRVPWYVQLPGHCGGENPPADLSTPVSLVDLFPTLCGLAGVDPPASLDGVDLSHAVVEGTEPDRGPVYCDNLVPRWGEGTEFRMVRAGEYKYVGFRDAPELLFDLADDPVERTDLSTAQPDAVAAELDRFRSLVDDTIDFDDVETDRRENATVDDVSLPIPKGSGNAYLFPDGRVVDADAVLYKPYVLADDPTEVYSDWPADTGHELRRLEPWRSGLTARSFEEDTDEE